MASTTYLTLGIDEVGRGALAGPVYVGGAVWPEGLVLPRLKDSKAYSSDRRRYAAYQEIVEYGLEYVTAYGDAETVDSTGIDQVQRMLYRKVMLLMDAPRCDRVILDGDGYFEGTESIPKADSLFPAVMAASVVAKIARDAEMVLHAKTYPEYGFDGHKGYGTKQHIEAIRTHGLCPLHRRSFCSRFV